MPMLVAMPMTFRLNSRKKSVEENRCWLKEKEVRPVFQNRTKTSWVKKARPFLKWNCFLAGILGYEVLYLGRKFWIWVWNF
jgi:hypothetical protein